MFAIPALKSLILEEHVPFVSVLLVLLSYLLIAWDPPKVLFGIFFLYAISGPLMWVRTNIVKKIRSMKKLAKLGLVVYQPRALIVVPEHIRINARCLVVQYAGTSCQQSVNPQERKILLGMLSVLELAANQIIMSVTVFAQQPYNRLLSILVVENKMLGDRSAEPQCTRQYTGILAPRIRRRNLSLQ